MIMNKSFSQAINNGIKTDSVMNKTKIKISSLLAISLLGCGFMAQAFAQDESLEQKQKAVLNQLEEAENVNTGVSLSGEMLSRFHSSELNSDDLTDGSPSKETSAFTQADVTITARPSKDTRGTLQFRVHQDWQNSYDQGPNIFFVRWWSYDGTIANKKISFNLGDFLTQYSPLTIYTPEPEFYGEAEIFKLKREEAMQERFIGNNDRLLTGLNTEYNSGKLGVENINARATIARLRNAPKKGEQVWYDFDITERFLLAGRLGFEVYPGIELGVNYVNVFDRVKSSRNFIDITTAGLGDVDTLHYETNIVNSGEFTADLAKALKLQKITLTLGVEYAMSNYIAEKDQKVFVANDGLRFIPGTYLDENGQVVNSVYLNNQSEREYQKVKVGESDGTAMIAELKAGYKLPAADILVGITYTLNDSAFQSDLAQSPAFISGAILNTDSYGSVEYNLGTLEGLYYHLFRTMPLIQQNTMNGAAGLPAETILTNNYERQHFRRNAYNEIAFTRSELRNVVAPQMDPTVNMIMPFGPATPNREGFELSLNSGFLDNQIELTGGFTQMAESDVSLGQADKTEFSGMGGSLGLYLNSFLKLKEKMLLRGGYELNTAKNGASEMEVARINGGAEIGFLKHYALLGGYQQQVATVGSLEVIQSIWAGGLKIKISDGSYMNIEYGNMGYDDGSNKFDRALSSAELNVKF
jgi:hypothetical protein